MDKNRKVLLQNALLAWKAKGNTRLAEAVAVALESEHSKVRFSKAA